MIKKLSLVPDVNFTSADYSKKDKTITINLSNNAGLDFVMREYRLKYVDNIPELNLISPTGSAIIFSNPKRSFSGINYENTEKGLSLKIVIF